MSSLNERVTFRRVAEQDIDTLVEIERQCFAVPWPAEAFFHDIQHNRFAAYIMIELDQVVVGYCGLWIILDEAHVTNIAILPDYRGKKLGETLLSKIMSVAKEAGAISMTLEVRVGNEAAKNLYKKLGFQEGGIRKNYYTDNGEDARVMWVNL